MSSSSAPSATASDASATLVAVRLAPSGKPTTVTTRTGDAWRTSRQSGTQTGFTHTATKPKWRASAHRRSMSDRVASAFRSVWSIRSAIRSAAGIGGRILGRRQGREEVTRASRDRKPWQTRLGQARRGQSGAGELHPVARRQCHAVRLDEPRLREQLDEHEPRYESTHVRPYGDTTGYVRAHLGQFGQAREELEPEPVEQHQPGRNRDDLEEDDEEEEHPDAHLRVEQQIRTHDPGNRPRRAHRRHWRRRIEGDVRGRRDQAADEVEREKAPRPHRVLDVVAEHPEEERVANDVHPAAVQEHGGQRREDVDWQIVHDACHTGANGHSEPKRSLVRQFARYHAEIAHARGKY